MMDGDFTMGDSGVDGVFASDAAFLRVVANPNRLQILRALLDEPLNVGALENGLGFSQAYVSQQLARLRAEGIVVGERIGRSVRYRIVDERVQPMLDLLHRFRTAP